MPRNIGTVVERTNIRLPTPMIRMVDRLVANSPYYKTRQEYVENALRERLEKDGKTAQEDTP